MGRYKEDLEIDPDNLDVECLTHSGRYQDMAEIVVDAKDDFDRAKRELDVSLAYIELDIRKNSKEKITEAVATALITTDPRTQLAYEKYFDIKKEYEIIKTGMDGWGQKDSRLKDLVKLHGQSYFAGPTEGRLLTREIKKKQEDNDLTEKAMEILRKGKKE